MIPLAWGENGFGENPVVSVIQPYQLWTVHRNITLCHYAIDPLILGVSKITWDRLTVNIAIGPVTPPVAVNLYVAANIAKLSFDEISRAVWPFVLAMQLSFFIVTQWPGLSTFLPALFGLK